MVIPPFLAGGVTEYTRNKIFFQFKKIAFAFFYASCWISHINTKSTTIFFDKAQRTYCHTFFKYYAWKDNTTTSDNHMFIKKYISTSDASKLSW